MRRWCLFRPARRQLAAEAECDRPPAEEDSDAQLNAETAARQLGYTRSATLCKRASSGNLGTCMEIDDEGTDFRRRILRAQGKRATIIEAQQHDCDE